VFLVWYKMEHILFFLLWSHITGPAFETLVHAQSFTKNVDLRYVPFSFFKIVLHVKVVPNLTFQYLAVVE